MKFEYSLLEALAAVVREGTFEAAAKSLNITQSAVSQRIKLLEEKTGAVLVARGRPCVATEHGQQLCRHINQVHLMEHDLQANLGAISNPRSSSPAMIRIAVNSDSLATWFPEVIRRARAELNLHFDIVPDDQEHTANWLKSGEALAAVTTSDKPLQGCRRVSLGAMDYIAIASPAFIDANFPNGVTISALSEATVLIYNRKDTLPEQWMLQTFGEVPMVKGHWLPSFSGYLACCLNGTGWGMMPTSTVEPYLSEGRLRELATAKPIPISLHWQSSAQGSEIMRLLSGIVVDVAREVLHADRYRA